MLKSFFCQTALTGALILPILSAVCLPTIAQTSPNETPGLTPATNPNISFRRPLRVTNIRIPIDWQYRRTEYLFTFDFPADAVEPLEKLVFEQIEGVDYPYYRPNDSYAFDADSRQQFPITATDNESDRTLTVEFDPPVAPGRQVTVALQARNPRDGIYQYRLTAFPAGAAIPNSRLRTFCHSRNAFRGSDSKWIVKI